MFFCYYIYIYIFYIGFFFISLWFSQAGLRLEFDFFLEFIHQVDKIHVFFHGSGDFFSEFCDCNMIWTLEQIAEILLDFFPISNLILQLRFSELAILLQQTAINLLLIFIEIVVMQLISQHLCGHNSIIICLSIKNGSFRVLHSQCLCVVSIHDMSVHSHDIHLLGDINFSEIVVLFQIHIILSKVLFCSFRAVVQVIEFLNMEGGGCHSVEFIEELQGVNDE